MCVCVCVSSSLALGASVLNFLAQLIPGVLDCLHVCAGEAERELLAVAQQVFPGGTTGNSCAKGIVIAEGKGPHVWDVSGNKYVDLAMGSGPMFIGHSHPAVVAAIQVRPPKLTVAFSQSSYIVMTYRVVGSRSRRPRVCISSA